MIDEQPGIALAIGLALLCPLVIALSIRVRYLVRTRRWTETTAKVSKVRSIPDGSGGRSQELTYHYTDATGVERTGSFSAAVDGKKGAEVTVFYDPTDPDQNQIFRALTWIEWLLGALAALLFLVGTAMVAQSAHLLATGRMLFG